MQTSDGLAAFDADVCIKNDTANVLVENVIFQVRSLLLLARPRPLTSPLDLAPGLAQDGHGASIGSVPDCNGAGPHNMDYPPKRWP